MRLDPPWLTPEETLAALTFRHATKRFDPERSIPPEIWETILEAARLSPSSFGLEPWHLLILDNPNLRQALLPVAWGAQGQFPTAAKVVALLARKGMRWDNPYLAEQMRTVKGLTEEAIQERLDRIRTFQTKHFQLLSSPTALFEWSARQCYLLMAQMMIAAALLGVDSCPIEGFERAAAEAILAQHTSFDPHQWGLVAFIAFGYRIASPPPKTRWPLERILTVYP